MAYYIVETDRNYGMLNRYAVKNIWGGELFSTMLYRLRRKEI